MICSSVGGVDIFCFGGHNHAYSEISELAVLHTGDASLIADSVPQVSANASANSAPAPAAAAAAAAATVSPPVNTASASSLPASTAAPGSQRTAAGGHVPIGLFDYKKSSADVPANPSATGALDATAAAAAAGTARPLTRPSSGTPTRRIWDKPLSPAHVHVRTTLDDADEQDAATPPESKAADHDNTAHGSRASVDFQALLHSFKK